MGTAAQIGRSAYAIDRGTPAGGRVKLSGQTWSARTLRDNIEPGEEVVVDSIDGATAIVSRAHVVGN
jgi:membrane protein implicated in regulation of membrane protease activity